MNYTIVSGQDGLVVNSDNKISGITLDVGCVTTSFGDVVVEAVTAKVTECRSGFISETEHDFCGDTSFNQMGNTLLQQGAIFSDVFPNQGYGIDCSMVSSDVTTYSLTDIQTAKLACAVYLQKIGGYVQVIVGANETSFQCALLQYEIPFKFSIIQVNGK